MNVDLTNPQQPAAPQAEQHADRTLQRAAQIAAAVDAVYEKPTSFRDDTPLPAIGTAPPVPQPGRPPMSQRAVDLNTTILTSSVFTAVLGGSATAVLWGSGQADPTVIGWVCAGVVALPVALAAPVLAVKGLMKSVKQAAEAAPPVIHQHYNGTVDQRQVHTTNRGIIANTRNQLPK
jgi:hypothetical protein